MTFNFDTYSADISNTPSILNSDGKFENVDAKFFAANLTACAFLGEKYNSQQFIDGTTEDNDYEAQVYLLTPNGSNASNTSKILAGFTWTLNTDGDVADMYFGVFEFEKPATTGGNSEKITGIKTYKVSTDAVSKIKSVFDKPAGQEDLLTCETGVFSKSLPLFGYLYDGTKDTSVSTFYLPPKSFFLDGKHASVTNPTMTGALNAVGSNIYSFKKTPSTPA